MGKRKPFGQVDGNRGGRSVSNASVQSRTRSTSSITAATTSLVNDDQFDFLSAAAADKRASSTPATAGIKQLIPAKDNGGMIDSDTKTPRISNVTAAQRQLVAATTTGLQQGQSKQQQQTNKAAIQGRQQGQAAHALRGKHQSSAFRQERTTRQRPPPTAIQPQDELGRQDRPTQAASKVQRRVQSSKHSNKTNALTTASPRPAKHGPVLETITEEDPLAISDPLLKESAEKKSISLVHASRPSPLAATTTTTTTTATRQENHPFHANKTSPAALVARKLVENAQPQNMSDEDMDIALDEHSLKTSSASSQAGGSDDDDDDGDDDDDDKGTLVFDVTAPVEGGANPVSSSQGQSQSAKPVDAWMMQPSSGVAPAKPPRHSKTGYRFSTKGKDIASPGMQEQRTHNEGKVENVSSANRRCEGATPESLESPTKFPTRMWRSPGRARPSTKSQNPMPSPGTPAMNRLGNLQLVARHFLTTSPRVPGSASLSKEPTSGSLLLPHSDVELETSPQVDREDPPNVQETEHTFPLNVKQEHLKEPPGASRGKSLRYPPGTNPNDDSVSSASTLEELTRQEVLLSAYGSCSDDDHDLSSVQPFVDPPSITQKRVAVATFKEIREARCPLENEAVVNSMRTSTPQENDEVGGFMVLVTTADDESCAPSDLTFDALAEQPEKRRVFSKRSQKRSRSKQNENPKQPVLKKSANREASGSTSQQACKAAAASNPMAQSTQKTTFTEAETEPGSSSPREADNAGERHPTEASTYKPAVTVATTGTMLKRKVTSPPSAYGIGVYGKRPSFAADVAEHAVKDSSAPPTLWTAQVAGMHCSAPVFQLWDGKRYQHPPIPPGWSLGISLSKNRPFYCHPDFGSTFYPPVALPLDTGNANCTAPTVPSPPGLPLDSFSMSQHSSHAATSLSNEKDASPARMTVDLPSSAFLVSDMRGYSETPTVLETPLFPAISNDPAFSTFSSCVAASVFRAADVNGGANAADLKDVGSSDPKGFGKSSTANHETVDLPQKVATDDAVAVKCIRDRKTRESVVDRPAAKSVHWLSEPKCPKSGETNPSTNLGRLWESPFIDGTKEDKQAEKFSASDRADSSARSLVVDDTAADASEAKNARGHGLSAAGAQSPGNEQSEDSVFPAEMTNPDSNSHGSIDEPEHCAAHWHSPDTQFSKNRDRDLPTEVDVDDSFFPAETVEFEGYESPGATVGMATPSRSSSGEGAARIFSGHYRSPPHDEQMDVLARANLISSRFMPKVRPLDDVSPLDNETASHFSRATESQSNASGISRSSSLRSNFSVGSYRVQHPPMRLCSLQNLIARPVPKTKKRKEKRTAKDAKKAKSTKAKHKAVKKRKQLVKSVRRGRASG